jgi:multidrug efflux pump subunit AcrB
MIEIAAKSGAPPDELARIVPQLETSLRAIDGLDFVTSLTTAKRSEIVLKFKPAVRPHRALADARDRFAEASKSLPPVFGAPRFKPLDAGELRVVQLGLRSDVQTAEILTKVADEIVKDRLQEVVGVGAVRVLGARRPEVHIGIDAKRLAAHGLSLAAIEAALRRLGLEVRTLSSEAAGPVLAVPAGRGGVPEGLNRLVVGERDGVAIELRDVARVSLGLRGDGIVARYDGEPAVIVEVVAREGADWREVTRAVRARLDAIFPLLPAGVEAKPGFFCGRCTAPPAR